MASHGWDVINVLFSTGIETIPRVETYNMLKRNNTQSTVHYMPSSLVPPILAGTINLAVKRMKGPWVPCWKRFTLPRRKTIPTETERGASPPKKQIITALLTPNQ